MWPQKGTLSKCRFHIRKSGDNDSSYNSYETSDNNFVTEENLAKNCLLFALWYNRCLLALQLFFVVFPRVKCVS